MKYRVRSIDLFRLIAALAIVVFHLILRKPFNEYFLSNNLRTYYFIINASRFAVPFFFITSGYFFGRSLKKGESLGNLLSRYVKRLLSLFLLWSLVYAVFPKYAILNIVRLDFNQLIYSVVDKVNFNFVFIQQHPFSFIFEGTNAHLWFFMSLIMALSILSAFIYYNKQDYAIYFSALLLCFGLLGGPYMHTILGIRLFYNYHFPVRYGPIFSTFFVVLGWLISYRDKRPSVQLSLLLILAGVILTSLEDLFLLRLFKQAPNYDYVIGTIFYSCGVFFLALSLVRIRKIKFLSSLGVLTLGVYAIHPLVIDNFRFSSSLLGPVLSFILNIAIIFIISCVATLTLYHFKPTRIMVR